MDYYAETEVPRNNNIFINLRTEASKPGLVHTDTQLFSDYVQLLNTRIELQQASDKTQVHHYRQLDPDYYIYEENQRHRARNTQVVSLINDHYKNSQGQDTFVIVELGAGVGRLGEELRKKLEESRSDNQSLPDFVYSPSDVSSKAVQALKDKNFSPIFTLADHLPYQADSCDVLYAGELIEHLSFPVFLKFLQESRRVLKSDATLILTTPNFHSLPAREDKKNGKIPLIFDISRDRYAAEHLLPFTKDSLEEILEKFGFEVKTVSTSQITRKIEKGVPTEFQIYDDINAVPDATEGDSLIVSAKQQTSQNKLE